MKTRLCYVEIHLLLEKYNILENKLMITRGLGGSRDRLGVWDRYVCTIMFKINSQQGPTVEHRVLC